MDIYENRTAEPMLIHGESEPFDSEEYSYELKMDGERCLAYLDPKDGTELINRRGRRVLPQFPELANLHKQVKKRCILDGELIVNVGSKEDFEFIKQRALTKNVHSIKRMSVEIPAIFIATDLLYLAREQITHRPLEERKPLLRKTVTDGPRMAVVQTIAVQGVKFFQLVKERGLEGVIAKKNSSLYLMGKRTREWAKFRNWEFGDFIICGYVPSDSANVVSLVLGQYDENGDVVYKGRVTLGRNRPEFQKIDKLPRAKTHPFTETPPEGADGAVWLKPRLVCNAGFICHTVNKRLRQPFFNHLSPDKHPHSARAAE